jgi:hypothetical protein
MMDKEEKNTQVKTDEASTKQSLKDGQQAIEMNKKIENQEGRDNEETEKKDAKKWREEG